MELVIELNGLDLPDWYSQLTKLMDDVSDVQIEEAKPAPGTLGAIRIPKIKVTLNNAASLASILALIVNLYAISVDDKKPESTHDKCEATFNYKGSEIKLSIPCKPKEAESFENTFNSEYGAFESDKIDIKISPAMET